MTVYLCRVVYVSCIQGSKWRMLGTW